MGQHVLLNLGQGNWQTGFPSVIAQLWDNDRRPFQFVGSLPAAPQLAAHYQRWQQLYMAIYGSKANWRRRAFDFEFDTDVPTNVSNHEFETLGEVLQTELSQWLMATTFAITIEHHIRTHLLPQHTVRVMLTAHDNGVLQFPWQLWRLFADYPNAELSLSLANYSRSPKRIAATPTGTVRILAVLGNDDGIDIKTDSQILEQLPAAEITLLAQPSLKELQHHLWESSWDILFFAGHSSSQGKGYLQVNPNESLTVEQLRYALGRAIANGLQLAILNSCDGLGLAWKLADLNLPQTIVMREPVPDAIAHRFLKAFLAALASGQCLYRSVREAREKLHGATELGACATWLPVIVQNPAEEPPTWRSLTNEPSAHPLAPPAAPPRRRPPQLDLKRQVLKTLALSAAVLGLRWFGLLQGAEVWAYDTLLQLRPMEIPDSRLVVVTVNEADIQAQTSLERRGSISDVTLEDTLTALASYGPRVIGLDVYRDFAATTPGLAEALAQPNIVGICKSLDSGIDNIGIGPAPELGEFQVGFSDFIEDTDGALRRQLLTLTPEPASPCISRFGFATLLAIHYLESDNIKPDFTPNGNLRLGETVFPRLHKRTGGLQRMDHQGGQVLLNYRALSSPDQIAPKVSLQQLLDGQVNPDSIRDRIVIIGVTATSGDFWATPYGVQAQNKTPGVYLQAQMVSQIVSAVLEDRPLIWVWPQWVEASSIVLAAILGSWLSWRWKSSQLLLSGLLTSVGLIIGAWATLVVGGWLPIVPALLALAGGTLSASAQEQT
ncbi:MAG: CHASE2 domain-containing protein [Cyanobacteria bacterium P01_H01_bin.26]